MPAAGLTVLICELDLVAVWCDVLTTSSNRDGLCWDAELAERVIFETPRGTVAAPNQHQS